MTTATIAILGACSKNGKTASHKLAEQNRLLLIDENKEELQQLKDELESQHKGCIEIMECLQDTGWEADAIVLAKQSANNRDMFILMKPYVTGKTIVAFYVNEEEVGNIKSLLPHSKVTGIHETDCECMNKMETIINEI